MADTQQAPTYQARLECSEAQDALLGAMILHPARIPEIRDEFGDDLFSGRNRSALYRCILKTYPSVDFVSLAPLMRLEGFTDPNTELLRLASAVSSSAHMKYHAGAVSRGRSILRWIEASTEASAELSMVNPEVEGECQRAIEEAERKLYAASQSVTKPPPSESAGDLGEKVVERLRQLQRPTGIETGLSSVDHLLGRIEPGNVCLVAARPGKGKTAFLLQMALNVARFGEKVLLVSLEMNGDEISARMLANLSGVRGTSIRACEVRDELGIVENALVSLKALGIHVCDDASITPARIRALIRRLKPTVLLIDYIQLLSDPGHKSRTEEMGAVSRGVKMTAKLFSIPVVAACQLNRDGDEVPKLRDLRESGSFEQDADQVILLWDESKPDDTREEVTLNSIVAKNRHGRCGMARLGFNRPTYRVTVNDFGLGGPV